MEPRFVFHEHGVFVARESILELNREVEGLKDRVPRQYKELKTLEKLNSSNFGRLWVRLENTQFWTKFFIVLLMGGSFVNFCLCSLLVWKLFF